MRPIDRDPDTCQIISMTLLRVRRLLQMAGNPGFNHKRFYGQYYFLQMLGYTGWTIGFAHLRPAGEERLAKLIEQGI